MSLIFMFGKGKEPDYSKVLPGVVKVSNSLYYDQTEITNLNWNEYLHWIAEKSGRKSAEYQDAFPDTNVWGGNGCCDSVMMNLYLRHPEFRDYPVVGVTQTQAMRYCAWRTDRVKENLAANKRRRKHLLSICIDYHQLKNGSLCMQTLNNCHSWLAMRERVSIEEWPDLI